MKKYNLHTWTLVAAIAVLVAPGCRSQRDLPGDTDPERPWAVSSAKPENVPSPPAVGIVDDKLFEVEAVMRHQSALGITPEQKKAILLELDAAQVEYNHLEWELNGQKEALAGSLTPDRVDEKAALEAGQRVTDLEGKLKIAHLRLLVRVKNQLTADQQAELRKLRK